MDLAFSGAGFMGCYYFGVVNCWNKYIPRDRVRRVTGASAGSLIAAYYCMDIPMDDCLKEIIAMTEHARSLPLGVFDRSNQIVDVLPRCLDKLFPEDAHKRVNGRLYVSMTRLSDFKNVIVNEFETRKDLIDALNCSCFIPFWSGNHVSTYKGVKYIDGGFTNNLPVFDEHTIRVSCFAGPSDIAPYDKVRVDMLKETGNLQGMGFHLTWKNFRRVGRALWPPPASFIVQLLEKGFHDAKEFVLENDLIQCDRCFRTTSRELQPIYLRAAPTISPAVSPSVSRASSRLDLAAVCRRQERGGTSDKETANKLDHKLQPVRIKEHRRRSTTDVRLDNSNRHKFGKRIGRKALERLRSDSELVDYEPQGEQHSFASRLREKLHQVAAKSAGTTECCKEQQAMTVPTIVIDDDESAPSQLPTRAAGQETKPRASSLLSNTSTDSALGMESPNTPNRNTTSWMSGSPAEKPIARPRSQTTDSTTSSNLFLDAGATTGKFSRAPSPLPSCPPSPNLNRHCSECIRLRQQARMDELDESTRRAAEMFRDSKTKEPEREFNSIKWKLACWLRQIGPTKLYSYSFGNDGNDNKQATSQASNSSSKQGADDGGQQQQVEGPDENEPDSSEETMAERKAKRKASHPWAWPASGQIQALS